MVQKINMFSIIEVRQIDILLYPILAEKDKPLTHRPLNVGSKGAIYKEMCNGIF